MSSLFDHHTNKNEPLASRMRPTNLDQFIGQSDIIGEGRLLRRSIESDKLSSVIFFGPPGTGKTSLAKLIAGYTKSRFVVLNAVLDGIKELKEALDVASNQKKLYGQQTILFVDEVHRWNKSQQDALLPWTENGTIILIGATTENPFYELNKALVSRSRIFNFTKLSNDDMSKALKLALEDKDRGLGKYDIKLTKEAKNHLINASRGDCRILYNTVELLVDTQISTNMSTIEITLKDVENVMQQKAFLYDKDGKYHYDTISAFIKSMTGSDVDAALYYLAVMLESGEDVDFIWRRLLILASEDVGLADPYGIVVVKNLCDSYHQVGLPEGYYFLSHATIYLASAPKSNSVGSFFEAQKIVQTDGAAEIPAHLKDSSRNKTMLDGQGYLYAHDYSNHWVAQQYLPLHLNNKVFYRPSNQGYEADIAPKILEHKLLQQDIIDSHTVIKSMAEGVDITNISNIWLNKHDLFSQSFKEWRSSLFDHLYFLKKASSIMFIGDEKAFLLLEAMRLFKEPYMLSLVNSNNYDNLNQLFSSYQSGLAYKFITSLNDGVGSSQQCGAIFCSLNSYLMNYQANLEVLLRHLSIGGTLVFYGDNYEDQIKDDIEKHNLQGFFKSSVISKNKLFYSILTYEGCH